jgi:HPt (histidine-containing phosphotransfer) domain-containing protein
MAELIELFVAELSDRLAALRQAVAGDDAREVARLAHQLKGAGGSHGFPQITAAAAEVERVAKGMGCTAELTAAINRLAAVCARCHSGRGAATCHSKFFHS